MSTSFPIGYEARQVTLVASAGQAVFPFAFPVIAADDIRVETAPAADPDNWTVVAPASFAVAGAGAPTGGSVTLTYPPAAGTRVRLTGRAVIAAMMDAVQAGRISAADLNRAFDRAALWAMESRRDSDTALAAAAWWPVLALVANGERRVQRVIDWVGGRGPKPATGQYLGATGYVTAIADAVDLRGETGRTGPQGPPGEGGGEPEPSPDPLVIGATPVLTATVGVAYPGFAVALSGGTAPIGLQLIGNWPPGSTVNSATRIARAGTGQAGYFPGLSIRATDSSVPPQVADLDPPFALSIFAVDPGTDYSQAALDLVARIGAQLSPGRLDAVEALFAGLETDGISLDPLYLRVLPGANPPTNIVSGDYALTPVGEVDLTSVENEWSGVYDTGFVPANVDATPAAPFKIASLSLGILISSTQGGHRIHMGADGAGDVAIGADQTDWQGAAGSGTVIAGGDGDSPAFVALSRSAGAQTLYADGTEVASGGASAPGLPTVSLYIGAQHGEGGAITEATGDFYKAAFIGAGLTQAKIVALQGHIEDFYAALDALDEQPWSPEQLSTDDWVADFSAADANSFPAPTSRKWEPTPDTFEGLALHFSAADENDVEAAPAMLALNVSPAQVTPGTAVTWSLSATQGSKTGSVKVIQSGAVVDGDFSGPSFANTLAAAAAAKPGVSFDTATGVLAFTEDWDGALAWSRTYTGARPAGAVNAVRLSEPATLSVLQPFTAVMAGQPALPVDPDFVRGINLAGGEFGNTIYNNKPMGGLEDVDYHYPEEVYFDYYYQHGFNHVRYPFQWERIQPNLFDPLDEADMENIDAAVQWATARGMTIALDLHDYGFRYLDNVAVAHFIGLSARVTTDAFIDLWTKIANRYKSNGRVWFGLMNEPVEHAKYHTADQWAAISKSTVYAIRATGALNKVLVPGISWTGAHTWTTGVNGYRPTNAEAYEDFEDPANNSAFEMHQYLDSDSSGTHAACTLGAGSGRLVNATTWLKAKPGRQAYLGEFAGSDPSVAGQEQCGSEIPALMTYMLTNKAAANTRSASGWIGGAVWGGGWGWRGTDKPPAYMFATQPGTGKPADFGLPDTNLMTIYRRNFGVLK